MKGRVLAFEVPLLPQPYLTCLCVIARAVILPIVAKVALPSFITTCFLLTATQGTTPSSKSPDSAITIVIKNDLQGTYP